MGSYQGIGRKKEKNHLGFNPLPVGRGDPETAVLEIVNNLDMGIAHLYTPATLCDPI